MNKASTAIVTFILAGAISACLQESSRTALASATADDAESASPAVPATAGDTSIVLRRMYEGAQPDFWGASPSPDGRYVTQTDWNTGDLAVLDLLTDELRRLTGKDDNWNSSYAYSEMARFSPDGDRIAYSWFTEPGHYELRVIDVDGANVRSVWTGERGAGEGGIWWPDLHGWSPDARHLLATLYLEEPGRESEGRLTLISVLDGATREVYRFLPRHGPEYAAISPDGRFIAFEDDLSWEPRAGRPDGDIYLVPVEGGAPHQLVVGPSVDKLLGWLPDGSLLFYSDRGLTEGVWRIPVSEGRTVGEPTLLRGDLWWMQLIGLSGDALYYGVYTEQPEVHTAGLDLEDGRLISALAPIERPSGRQTRGFEWSPDGSVLAYVKHDMSGQQAYLVIRSVSGEERQEIPLPIVPRNRWLMWSPDGESIFLMDEYPETGEPGVLRFDLNAGSLEVFLSLTDENQRLSSFSADLRTAYLRRVSPDEDALIARDVSSGEERVLTVAEDRSEWPWGTTITAPSADGRLLAVLDTRTEGLKRIVVLSTAGGEPREVWSRPVSEEHPPGGRCARNVTWGPDHRTLVFVDSKPLINGEAPSAEPCELVKVSVDGGEPVVLGGLPPHGSPLRLHPDGNRIALMIGDQRGEIWRMENLPGLEASGR